MSVEPPVNEVTVPSAAAGNVCESFDKNAVIADTPSLPSAPSAPLAPAVPSLIPQMDTLSCETTEELLETDWIQSYKEFEEFNNFCQSKDGNHLMIENNDGTWWWVVARVSKNSLQLPIVRMNK